MFFLRASKGYSDRSPLPHLSPQGRGRSRSAAQASGEGSLHALGFADRPLTRIASGDAIRPLPSGERCLTASNLLNITALHRALDRLEAAYIEQHLVQCHRVGRLSECGAAESLDIVAHG